MRKSQIIKDLQLQLQNETARRTEAEKRVEILREEIDHLHHTIDVITFRIPNDPFLTPEQKAIIGSGNFVENQEITFIRKIS